MPEVVNGAAVPALAPISIGKAIFDLASARKMIPPEVVLGAQYFLSIGGDILYKEPDGLALKIPDNMKATDAIPTQIFKTLSEGTIAGQITELAKEVLNALYPPTQSTQAAPAPAAAPVASPTVPQSGPAPAPTPGGFFGAPAALPAGVPAVSTVGGFQPQQQFQQPQQFAPQQQQQQQQQQPQQQFAPQQQFQQPQGQFAPQPQQQFAPQQQFQQPQGAPRAPQLVNHLILNLAGELSKIDPTLDCIIIVSGANDTITALVGHPDQSGGITPLLKRTGHLDQFYEVLDTLINAVPHPQG